jgi:cytochrome c5
METSMKRAFAVTATMFLLSISLAAQEMPAQPRPHMSMPKPTNLQVLPKDISPEELMKLMGSYSQALGVHCSFCHEVNEQTHRPDFASDAKPDKAIARTMIAMTQTINQKYLSTINDPDATPEMKTVTCGTCHRGNIMPAPFVPKTAEHAPPGGPAMQK